MEHQMYPLKVDGANLGIVGIEAFVRPSDTHDHSPPPFILLWVNSSPWEANVAYLIVFIIFCFFVVVVAANNV